MTAGKRWVRVLCLMVFVLGLNHPPRAASPTAPVITEPNVDGKILNPADVHMEAPAFSDPDRDTHVCSDWEIRVASSFELIWQSPCAPGVLKVHIHLGDGTFMGSYAGRSTLDFSTNYRLRVRYKDSANENSVFSERLFTTSQAGPAGAPSPIPWSVKQAGYQVELVATGFQLPVNIAFVPNPGNNPLDPFFYVTELYGKIKVVTRNGTVQTYASNLLNYNPTGSFPGSGEQGVAGIVVDPANGDVIADLVFEDTLSPASPKPHYCRVVRFHSTDGGHTMATMATLLTMPNDPTAISHQISNLSIGPDGKLYVHNGDGFDASKAQDLNFFRGKILRMNLDGTAPTSNPFYNAADGITPRDYVYASGFRNPFGGGWRLSDGMHYEVENGPSVDRLARVVAGRNYGWDGTDASMATFAAYNWPQAHAPVNMVFVQTGIFNGCGFPIGKLDHAFVSESGPTFAVGPQSLGKRISEFTFDANGNRTSGPTPLIEYSGAGYGSVVGLAAGPDGLYFTDLYRDMNGSPVSIGANIFRVRYVAGQPPNVSITNPANNTSFTAPVSITIGAVASDPDGTVTRVEFFANTTPLGTDTTSPYSVTWTNAPAGTHFLTAVATDDSGAVRSSVPVTARVTGSGGPPPASGSFGKTTIGALSMSPGEGYKFGSVYTLTESGTATGFSWYVRGGGAAQKFTPVLYNAAASGTPTSFVASGAEVTIAAGQAPGWVTSALPSVPLAAGNYLLGLLSGPATNGAFNYADSAANSGVWNANAYPAPSNLWGAVNLENTRWSFYVSVTPAVQAPVNTAPPYILGNTVQGQILEGNEGLWTGTPIFAYQWQRCNASGNACIDIGGATLEPYMVVAADVGATLRFAATATEGSLSARAVSAPTAVITGPALPAGSTFGNTAIGALSLSPAEGFKFGSVYSLSEAGTATGFTWYMRGGAIDQKFTPVLYTADASDNPTSLAAMGAEVTIAAGQAPGWVTSALSSVPLTPGKYLLGLLSGPGGNGAFNYADSVPNAGAWNANAYPGPSSLWGAVNHENAHWSFYVTYTPSGPPPPLPGRFGTMSIGAFPSTPGAGYKFGSVFALSEPGTATGISWYTRGGGADQKFTPVLYNADASGTPTTLVAMGAELTIIANQESGWAVSPLPNVSLTPGKYLLGLLSGPAGSSAFTYYDIAPSAGVYNANSYPTPSNAWGAVNLEDRRRSTYVTYTPAPPPVPQPPVNTSLPAITGTAQQGQILTGSAGIWTGSPSFGFRWQQCNGSGTSCVDIGGATFSTYMLVAADAGATIRFAVTATNAVGSTSAVSAATSAITGPLPPAPATFGSTTIGANFSSPGTGYKFGSVSTLTQPATATSISFYTRGGGSAQKFSPVIYNADASGNPRSFVAMGAEVTVSAGQAPGWVSSALPNLLLTPGKYLLGLLSGPAGSGAFTYWDAIPSAGFYNANPYPAPAPAWGAITVESMRRSIYVTYTPRP